MNDPGDPGNPLQGLLGDLLKMIGSAQAGGTAWQDAARALAQGVATEARRRRTPTRSSASALRSWPGWPSCTWPTPPACRSARAATRSAVLPVGPRRLGPHGPRCLDPAPRQDGGRAGQGPPCDAADRAWRPDSRRRRAWGTSSGQFATTMGPVLLGLQFGSAAGHLAQRALGRYALPMPWPDHGDLVVVPVNIAAFAEDWSLPVDQAQLWVCVRELTAHAVLGLPHVAEQLTDLLEEAATGRGLRPAGPGRAAGRRGRRPEALQSLLSDPEALLADLLTPGQRRTLGPADRRDDRPRRATSTT